MPKKTLDELIAQYVEALQDVVKCIVASTADPNYTKHDVDDAFSRMVVLYEDLRDAAGDARVLTSVKH